MILMEAATHNLHLHQARNYIGTVQYVLVYGLEVTHFTTRKKAVHNFARCLDHAEECETGKRPIFGDIQ